MAWIDNPSQIAEEMYKWREFGAFVILHDYGIPEHELALNVKNIAGFHKSFDVTDTGSVIVMVNDKVIHVCEPYDEVKDRIMNLARVE